MFRVAFLGGFFGLWCGMKFFHHKTDKENFTLYVFLATAACVGAFLFWYFAPQEEKKVASWLQTLAIHATCTGRGSRAANTEQAG